MQAQDRSILSREKKGATPAVFIGHGSPMVAIEYDDYSDQLCSFLQNIPRPTSIVVVSAHWETRDKIKISSNEFPEQLYDFEGYPETLYLLTYPCTGNPELAFQIKETLSDFKLSVELDETRGIDHGVWIPLYVAFPDADIPVVQISLPRDADPKLLLDLGSALAHLRETGVLLIGSGNLVQNKELANMDDKYAEPEPWAIEADKWVNKQLRDMNINGLLNYDKLIPHKNKVIPSKSHFLPLFFVLGAAAQKDHFVIVSQGFHYGNMSMTSFAFTRD